ncbi:MAG: hypothetical protein ACYSR0_08285 [Planctomycetota bacterium]|jgi:hypothetical protein
MRYSLIISVLILGISVAIASCKKAEEVKVERAEDAPAYVRKQGGLANVMKKASLVMRRLARAVENNDWVEMEMWTQELKEGIGFYCVTLYMIETNDVSLEFIMLSNKFNSALNKLILYSKEHDINNANLEFSMLTRSCDACHDRFYEKMGKELEFTDLVGISINKDDGTDD